jgi:integrase
MAKKIKKITSTRRGNGEGSIYQRKDGRWIGMATVGLNEDGTYKRKAVYGKTRTEASKKLTALTKKITNDTYDYVNNSDLSTMMHEWLLVFKKNTVTARTFENAIRHFNLHIKPYAGKMKLDEITYITVQKLLNDMLDKNYSLAYTKKLKFLLSQFFEYCVDNKLIENNPIEKTRVKSRERKIYDGENKYKAIPIDIREEFIRALDSHTFLKPLCLCMMFSGLRTGEALALTWDNIDFNNKSLKVEKGIREEPKFDEQGKVISRKTVLSATKTAGSVRQVPMPDILIDALKRYQKRQWATGKDTKVDLLSPNMFVFANDNGSVRTYSGTKSIFVRFLKNHGLDKHNIHFHGLRHTYSNMLFEAGENPKVIQALLGHKSVKTTITTYNSVDKSYFEKATNIFNEQYKVKEVSKEQPQQNNTLDSLNIDDLNELIKLLDEKRKALAEKDKNDFEM